MEIGRKRKGPLNAAEKIRRNLDENRLVGVMSFPADLGVHSFLMNFVDYNFNGDSANEQTTLSVALPLPGSGITDAAALSYNETALGTVGASLTSVGGELVNKLQNAGNETGDSEQPEKVDYTKLAASTIQLGGAIARELNPVQSLKNASDLALGNVTNPHVALLFQQVGLKKFTLNWKLAPQSEEESRTLKDIIKSLQKAIHPSFVTSENNFYLKYPNQVDCFYQGSGDFLHFFKRAAVTEFSANYQPEGGNLLMAGTGAPAVIDLTMGFQEVEIWTSEDYQ